MEKPNSDFKYSASQGLVASTALLPGPPPRHLPQHCPLRPVSYSPSPSRTLPSLLPPHVACYCFQNVLPSMLFPSAPFIEVSIYKGDFPTLHTDRPTYLDKCQPPEVLAKQLLKAEWSHKVQQLVYHGIQLSFKLVQDYSANG